MLAGKQALSTILKLEKNIEIINTSLAQNSDGSDEYKRNVYECIGLMINKEPLKNIIQDIKRGDMIWSNGHICKHLNEIQDHDDFINKPAEVVDGVIQCKKCGSNKTRTMARQVRSGDEGTSVFCVCTQCNSKWRES